VAPAAAQALPEANGYWLVGADGAVFAFGGADDYGSMAGTKLVSPIVGTAATSSGRGYWMAAADGGVFDFGDAPFHGAMGGTPLNKPVVGMAATPDGGGYWLVARDGGVFSFGNAKFAGSMGGQRLNAPVVGMTPGQTAASYWIVASDGGIFAFNAPFKGSMGGQPLNKPIVGMARTASGQGYWMVASDGGIFAFGDAEFHGSMGGQPLNRPIVGMAPTPTGDGYWLVADDGGMFSFGDAGFFGSTGGRRLDAPIIGMAAHVPGPPAPPPDPTILAAGDIASCSVTADEETAKLLDNRPGTVLALGDLVYDNGTAEEFENCYGPNWGRHKARTRPAIGNHEYGTPGAAGYFGYFGALAGDPSTGYYSFDLGSWHLVSLNSEDCVDADGCPAGSPQETWLKADLAASDAQCTLVYWHRPRYSSTEGYTAVDPLWDAASAGGVDVALSGHIHNYERFAVKDGIRHFVVGTGGKSIHGFNTPPRIDSEVRNAEAFGILQMKLKPGTFEWEFVPVAGQTFTDSGSGACR